MTCGINYPYGPVKPYGSIEYISKTAELIILTAAGVCTCVVVFKSLSGLHHSADYIF